jgi:hypothetical protein
MLAAVYTQAYSSWCCHLTIAILGCPQVTLSDNVPPLLLQLRRSVQETLALRGKQHPDTQQQHPASAVDSSAGADLSQPAASAAAEDDIADWDPEDADSCDGLDDFLAAADGVSMEQSPAPVSGRQAARQPGSAASQQEASLQQGGAWDWVRYSVASQRSTHALFRQLIVCDHRKFATQAQL